MKHTKSYIKGHPNPQFSRSDFLNLNGKWDFCFDDENIGIKKKYFKNFPQKLQIEVPYTYEYPASNIKDDGIHNIVWYHKTINLKKTNKRTILHLDGVDYEAQVYVNGQYVGNHRGAYSAFSFDISEQLIEGINSIVIRCYDDFSCTRARGKQRWMDHNYECFYLQSTGIHKTVWLEFVSETYLKSVLIDPSYKDTNVYMEYEIEGDLTSLDIETIIKYDDLLISRSQKTVTRNTFSETIDITSDNATMKIHSWTSDNPCLYDVEFNVFKNGILIDSVRSYFGVAEYASTGNSIYLNRHIIYPRLILNQGYHPETGISLNEQQIIKDITLMKEIGLNGNRIHQKIESELFYYYCDILGFYIWQELPSAYEWKKITPYNLSSEWMDILKEHHNHPSIMAQVIVNESWGTMAIKDHQEQMHFATGLYHYTKSFEKNRFVISNDGWEHTESDLITLHDYAEEKEELLSKFKIAKEDIFANHHPIQTGNKAILANGYTFNDKPIILSEFAGIAFSKDQGHGWGYGYLVKDEEQFLERLKGQIDAIFESHLFAGFCITQLSDVQQEVNGLVDEYRNYKADKEKLRAIITRKF